MKKTTVILVALIAAIMMILSCTKGERNNPCDPGGTNFQGVTISSDPKSLSVTDGQAVSFSVGAQGANVQYQWQKDGIDIPDANSAILSFSSAITSLSGSYRCIVWNSWESDTSVTATLKVISIYTITYDGNGYTTGIVPWSQTKTQGIPITLSGNTGSLVKTGYIFSCWNTSPDGSGANYAIGASYVTDDNVTLYAKWTPAYTIIYDGNGYTSGSVPSFQTKTQGIPLTLSGNTGNLVKTGYTFSGWNTAMDGSGTNYAFGASYTTDTNAVLYAKWTVLPTYLITYYGNGNTSGSVPLSQTKTQGIPLTLSGNTGNLVKTGFTFSGWNTSPDGTGTYYAPGASYTADTSARLYAEWTLPPPSIITQPLAVTVNAGQSATFRLTATGTSLQYQWQRNGVNISGAISSIYSILSTSLADNGYYKCYITNSSGSVMSDSVVLTVNQPVTSTIFYDEFNNNSNGWDTTTYSGWKATIGNSILTFTSYDSSHAFHYIPRDTNLLPISGTFSIETKAKYLSGTDNVSYGFEFCGSGYSWTNLYTFQIAKYGYWYLIQANSSGNWLYPASKYTDLIKQGDYNILKITKAGSYIYFYINNQWVFTWINSDSNGRTVGFFNQMRQSVAFDYLKIYQ